MDPIKVSKIQSDKNGYLRCLSKAMDKTKELFQEDDAVSNHERIHFMKSILYAAIERAGIETDRLISAQELLRELLILVALQADPFRH